MENSAIYLDNAAACLDITKRLGPDFAPALVELAKAWQRLAEEAMAEATLVPAANTAAVVTLQ
jgi:hypothetical protein